MTGPATSGPGAVGFADVLRVRAFRVLYGAEVQSIIGDQLARVALSVLVFSRTGSDTAAALTYTLTYLPTVVGGFVLAGVGDRWRRRSVMAGCDVLRAAGFAVMAVPGLPLSVVLALLAATVFIAPAFTSSSAGYLAAELTGEQFRAASGLRLTSNQLAQVVGFAAGGLLTAAVGVRATLVLNAATYVASAVVVTVGLHRDGGRVGTSATGRTTKGGWAVLATVLQDRAARSMVLLSLLAGLYVVPEALAVPFAAAKGAGSAVAGLLIATIPLGSAIGIVLLLRWVRPGRRSRLLPVLAAATGVPLAATVAFPTVPVAAALWLVSGVAAAYQVEVFVGLVYRVPDEVRGRFVSVFGSLLLGVQGLGPLVFGALAGSTSPAAAISIAGGLGTLIALTIGVLARDRYPSRHSAQQADAN